MNFAEFLLLLATIVGTLGFVFGVASFYEVRQLETILNRKGIIHIVRDDERNTPC